MMLTSPPRVFSTYKVSRVTRSAIYRRPLASTNAGMKSTYRFEGRTDGRATRPEQGMVLRRTHLEGTRRRRRGLLPARGNQARGPAAGRAGRCEGAPRPIEIDARRRPAAPESGGPEAFARRTLSLVALIAHYGGIEFYFPVVLVFVFRMVFVVTRGKAVPAGRNTWR